MGDHADDAINEVIDRWGTDEEEEEECFINGKEPIDTRLIIRQETERGLLVDDGRKEFWLPKSQVTYNRKHVTIVPAWLAAKHGIDLEESLNIMDQDRYIKGNRQLDPKTLHKRKDKLVWVEVTTVKGNVQGCAMYLRKATPTLLQFDLDENLKISQSIKYGKQGVPVVGPRGTIYYRFFDVQAKQINFRRTAENLLRNSFSDSLEECIADALKEAYERGKADGESK